MKSIAGLIVCGATESICMAVALVEFPGEICAKYLCAAPVAHPEMTAFRVCSRLGMRYVPVATSCLAYMEQRINTDNERAKNDRSVPVNSIQ